MRILETNELSNILDAHKLFTIGHPKGVKADFSDVDLSNVTFNNVNLSGVSFAGSNLNQCNFIVCDLAKADFSNSEGGETSFVASVLTLADFNNADLCYGEFTNCEAIGVNFVDAEISHFTLKDTDFTESNFFNATIKKITQENCNFSSAIGNGKQIISMQIGGEMVVYTEQSLSIAGYRLPVNKKGEKLDFFGIADFLESGELPKDQKEYFYAYVELIKNIITLCPAKPFGA